MTSVAEDIAICQQNTHFTLYSYFHSANTFVNKSSGHVTICVVISLTEKAVVPLSANFVNGQDWACFTPL